MIIRSTRATALLGVALAVGWTSPAAANWETLRHITPAMTGRCDKPHDEIATVRRSENQPFLVHRGISYEVEVFGHLIDDPGFVAQVFGAGTGRRVRGVGGPENIVRGCGSIGSVLVRINIPDDAPYGRSELRIGRGGDDWHARVPIQIGPVGVRDVVWDARSFEGGSGAPQTMTVAANPSSPRLPPPPVRSTGQTGGNGQGGQGTSGGGGAAPPGGARSVNAASPTTTTTVVRARASAGGCLRAIGGDARWAGTSNSSALTLELPAGRDDEVRSCLELPLFLEIKTMPYDRPLDEAFAYTSPQTGPSRRVAGADQAERDGRIQSVRFTESFIAQLPAPTTVTLRASPATSGARDMTVRFVRARP